MASRLGYRLALRLYSTAAANRFNGRVAIVTGGASGQASSAKLHILNLQGLYKKLTNSMLNVT